MSALEEADEDPTTPAEVIEVGGQTGAHGEVTQVQCRIRDGDQQGQIIRRNIVGAVPVGDILQLRETAREADQLGGE